MLRARWIAAAAELEKGGVERKAIPRGMVHAKAPTLHESGADLEFFQANIMPYSNHRLVYAQLQVCSTQAVPWRLQ